MTPRAGRRLLGEREGGAVGAVLGATMGLAMGVRAKGKGGGAGAVSRRGLLSLKALLGGGSP